MRLPKNWELSRTTVSKYLKRAKEMGIVKIFIVQDSFEALESQLEDKFSLKEVFIVPSSKKSLMKFILT